VAVLRIDSRDAACQHRDREVTDGGIEMADTGELTPEQRLRRELAMLRANEAPVLFFEVVSSLGVRNGVVNLTLEGGHHIVVDGINVNDTRVVAHLRFPFTAMANIRDALDKVDLLAQPPASEEKN
jgi:hypothetical protein